MSATSCRPHRQVLHARSRVTGLDYPVVRVPPHGAVPVVARANGPQVGREIKGVSLGTHYVRVQGPRSVGIDRPELWRDVIHRCMINERESLLGSIGRLFDRPVQPAGPDAIDALVDAASARWADAVPEAGWPVDPKVHRSVFAYRILAEGDAPVTPLPLASLRAALREASHASDAVLGTGWNFFL